LHIVAITARTIANNLWQLHCSPKRTSENAKKETDELNKK